MEDIKVVFASNLIKLRTDANMTQAELAEKINYSDKSVSKWERAEALPDICIALKIANVFNVSLDFMLTTHDKWERKAERNFSPLMIILVTMVGIWTLALLLFIIMWILGKTYWMLFLIAIPVSLITLLVLNSIWYKRKNNLLIVSGIVLSIFLNVYYALITYNPWQIALLAIPAEIIVCLSFKIKK